MSQMCRTHLKQNYVTFWYLAPLQFLSAVALSHRCRKTRPGVGKYSMLPDRFEPFRSRFNNNLCFKSRYNVQPSLQRPSHGPRRFPGAVGAPATGVGYQTCSARQIVSRTSAGGWNKPCCAMKVRVGTPRPGWGCRVRHSPVLPGPSGRWRGYVLYEHCYRTFWPTSLEFIWVLFCFLLILSATLKAIHFCCPAF